MRLLPLVLVVLAAAACAATRPSLGDIQMRPYTDVQAIPHVFSVQDGRILSPELDLSIDEHGCALGVINQSPIQLCSKAQKGEPSEPGGLVEHWAGSSGDLTTELIDKGKSLRADGFLNVGGGVLPIQTTLPLGNGPKWDELRKHPILAAVAAAVSGVRGEPDQYSRDGVSGK